MAIICEVTAHPSDKKRRDAKIRAILQSPDLEFVEMAIGLVNLDDAERITVGAASGLASTGADQVVKQLKSGT